MKKLPFNPIVLNAWRAKIKEPDAIPNSTENSGSRSRERSLNDDFNACCNRPSSCKRAQGQCFMHDLWLWENTPIPSHEIRSDRIHAHSRSLGRGR